MDEKRRNIFARLMDEAGLPPEEALEMVQNASESAMDALVGVGEVGLSVASGLAGVVAGLPGSTGEVLAGRGTEEQREKYPGLAPTPEDTLLPTVGEMAEKWTYQPRTETGQQYAENVGKFMEPVDKGLKWASGFIPGIVEKVPGDSRLGSGILNAADQAIYTALNVMSPTRGLGTGAMLGAKGLQAAGKAAGMKNLDLVTPAAQAVEKAPIIKRFNQVNHAMGQLITRKQLAGLQPGMVQQVHAWKPASYVEGPGQWYGKAGKGGHLKSMASTAGWNVLRKMTDNQDAWLRSHYGITANVYQELERLGRVIDMADQQAKVAKSVKVGKKQYSAKSGSPYLDEAGNHVIKETGGNPMTIAQVRADALNQYHAQIAYNRSVLEKYKPGDPRIERLASGELDQYLTPKHRKTTINELGQKPAIIQDLIGRNIDTEVIKHHIAPNISKDLKLKGSNVHLSTKPFFFKSAHDVLNKYKPFAAASGALAHTRPSLLGRTVVKGGRGVKLDAGTHGPYTLELRRFVQQNYNKGVPLTKETLVQHFKNLNKSIDDPDKSFSIKFVEDSITDHGDWLSMTQWGLTDDTLLATMPIRMVINKKNPDIGYFILYDQMKQGSGIPILEYILDAGSDINRVYMDIHPIKVGYDWPGYAKKVEHTTPIGEVKGAKGVIASKLREQEFDVPPTEEFLRKRRFGRSYMPPLTWASKRGSTAGLLAQDENV